MTVSADDVTDEVRRLHKFFDDWFTGRPGRAIGEFSGVLDEEFTIVGPHGSIMTGPSVVAAVEESFGVGDAAITVENFHVRCLGDVWLCRYDELQGTGEDRTRRTSTAVMVSGTSTTGGLRWVSVHETFVEV